MATRMQQRRGTASQWTAANPTLAAGEIGFETDTNKFKMGNGATAWAALDYFSNSTELAAAIDAVVGIAPETLDTLSELAAALNNDPGFLATLGASITATNARLDLSILEGVAALTAASTQTQTNLSNHSTNGTNVHGIADTSLLATLTTVATAKSEAITSANSALQEALTALTKSSVGLANVDNTSDADKPVSLATQAAIVEANEGAVLEATNNAEEMVYTHHSITQGVHGIADTSLLATVSNVSDAKAEAIEESADAIATAGFETDTKISTAIESLTKSSVGLSSVDNTADDSKPVSTAQALAINTAKSEAVTDAGTAADTKVSDHNLETENVHGIADTAELVTQTDLTNAILGVTLDQSAFAGEGIDWNLAEERFDIDNTIATKIYADGAVSDHNLETENIHGISDTAELAYKNAANQVFSGVNTFESDVTIEGNLVVEGTTTTVNTSEVQIDDPLFYLSANQYDSNIRDIGITGAYGTVGGTEQDHLHTGLVKDVTDGKWKLFSNTPHPVNNVVDFTSANYDTLKVGPLEATTVAASSGIIFSDGTQTKLGVPSVTTFATEVTSSATLAAGEEDKFVPLNGAVTITLPASGYSTGQSIDFYQATGTGASFASTNGVVGTPGYKFRTTNSVVTAMKTPSGWLIFGDLGQ